jgi:putative sporulation protein YtxC
MGNQDIEALINKAWQHLNQEEKTYLPETRKHVLVKAILEFLDSHHRFDIEGFMNFRADLYKRELRKQVARAVNEYALEQEHEGFVHLLKRFLDAQHSIYQLMHLVIRPHGEVLFFDDRGRNLNEDCLEENCAMLKEAAKERASVGRKNKVELYEDFLVSALLKCAPRQLVVHATSEQHADMIQIIYEVFGQKMSFCSGCSLCRMEN